MNKKALTLIISSIAVVAVCVGIVSFVRKDGGSPVPEIQSTSSTTLAESTSQQIPEQSTTLAQITQTVTETVLETMSTTATTKVTTTLTTKAEDETTRTIEDAAEDVEDMEIGHASTPSTSSGKLPSDMTFAGLYLAGYDVIGFKPYLYNNDKDCVQSEFGYNEVYDKGASLIDFHIKTCRIKFYDYDGRDWLVQLWKGQYISGDVGTVGCEIGLYNRKAGTPSLIGHYNCATEADWLGMEMTMYWDENRTGNYTPQFTRDYTKYWWPTGFVDGQMKNVKDTQEIFVLARITFKDTLMTDKFVEAMSKLGFQEVSSFSPYTMDTYKRYGCDVIFTWRDILN